MGTAEVVFNVVIFSVISACLTYLIVAKYVISKILDQWGHTIVCFKESVDLTDELLEENTALKKENQNLRVYIGELECPE